MRVQFVRRESGPERLVCEAELFFDDDGPLAGMKLAGFGLWRSPEGEIYVTFPARSFGAGNDRKYYDYLRPVDSLTTEARRVKTWILEEYRASSQAA